MLKISILDTPSQRRLLIEGKLIGPWATELASVWRQATADLNGRALIIDVKGLTAITEDGENVLLELIKKEPASARPVYSRSRSSNGWPGRSAEMFSGTR